MIFLRGRYFWFILLKPDQLSLICSPTLTFSVFLYKSLPSLEKECVRPESELTPLVFISFKEIKPEVLFLTLVRKKEIHKQDLPPKCLFSPVIFLKLLYNKIL